VPARWRGFFVCDRQMSGSLSACPPPDNALDDTSDNLNSIPDLTSKDIETLLSILLGGSNRIEKVVLSHRTVWIKRYGTEKPTWWRHLQAALSHLIPLPYLRPSPYLSPREMAEREQQRIRQLASHDIAVPDVLYASRGAIVLADVGITVQTRLHQLKGVDVDARFHDDLLVACAAELGRLHASGEAHGRPYPRDMFFAGERLGFMDFEEEPQAVMPLEMAQARDLWLLFLQISSNARLGRETFDRAYQAWAKRASSSAIAQLGHMTGFLGRFLSLARLIGRVRMGSDLRRFIVATEYLMTASGNPQGRTR
jgi:tRNA A-37 threonylcarbamoyl transferase component Bud32